ncbi:MAG: response regulator [Myxococcaceae bacterium]
MTPLILLAEDDDPMRELLREQLERRGFKVVEVEDGYELKDYLALSRPGGDVREPDAVVTDLRMPGEDGLEALAEFGHHERVVLISAFADHETFDRAHEHGVNVVLAKPFTIEALMAEIERVLRGGAR